MSINEKALSTEAEIAALPRHPLFHAEPAVTSAMTQAALAAVVPGTLGRTVGSYLSAESAPDMMDLALRAALAVKPQEPFQQRMDVWLLACFGEQIARDKVERNHRFLEESLELVQALGCTSDEAHQLVDYTFGRPAGEPRQEVGGVITTLAALCQAQGLDMMNAAEAPECQACGSSHADRLAYAKRNHIDGYKDIPVELTSCQFCDSLKCCMCDMGDDVPCLNCEEQR